MRISVSKLFMFAAVLGFLTLCSQADAGLFGGGGGHCGGHGKLFGGCKLFKGCGSSCCEETTCCEEEAPAEEAAECECPEPEACCESSCCGHKRCKLFGGLFKKHRGGCCEESSCSSCNGEGSSDESSPSDSGNAPPAPEEV